jgi:TonB family protein
MKALSYLILFVFSLLVLACGKSKEAATEAGQRVTVPAPVAAQKVEGPVLPPPLTKANHPSPGRKGAGVSPMAARKTTARAQTTAPSPAVPHELGGLYRELDKPVQSFSLPASKDTLLTCREGTTLHIPAHAFVSAETGEPVTGPVAFRVKEYYSIADALLANLSTMTKSDLLETGGMVYLEAVADGEACALKEGALVRIGFPYREEKEGMQLFNGRWENGTMRWDAAAQPAPDEPEAETIFQVVEQMPEFKGGIEKLQEYMRKTIRYPRGAARRNVQGNVFVGFVVGRNGEIENSQVLKGIDPVLDGEALRVINGMPRWNPGKQSGKTVKVRYALPIRFVIDGGMTVTSDTVYQTEFERNPDDRTLGKADSYEVSRYLFSTSRLGWINCDRFYNYTGPRTDYFVNVGQAEEVDIKIVFNSLDVIITGMPYQDKHWYFLGSLPVGQKITIVALKRENGTYYLAVQKTQVKGRQGPELSFEPVTMQKLKAEMAKLGRR